MVCQAYRNCISDLFVGKGSGWFTCYGFKIVIIWKSLNSCRFPGSERSVLFDIRMNVVVPIPANMCHNCLRAGKISCNHFKSVQKALRIIMCPQMFRKICICNTCFCLIPRIYHNSIDFKILLGVRPGLVKCDRLAVIFLYACLKQIFSRVMICWSRSNVSLSGMNTREITEQFPSFVCSGILRDIRVEIN